jgi:hypothetical protein
LLNTFGGADLVALVYNYGPDERPEAIEFMSRMPYTFVNIQADMNFMMRLPKLYGTGPVSTLLVDREGRVIYDTPPTSVAAEARFSNALKLLLAHETRQREVNPGQ